MRGLWPEGAELRAAGRAAEAVVRRLREEESPRGRGIVSEGAGGLSAQAPGSCEDAAKQAAQGDQEAIFVKQVERVRCRYTYTKGAS